MGLTIHLTNKQQFLLQKILRWIPFLIIFFMLVIFVISKINPNVIGDFTGIYLIATGVAFLYLIDYFKIVEEIPPYLKFFESIHPNQNDYVNDFLKNNLDARFEKIDIIQYSGSTIQDILTDLIKKEKCDKIRLLLFHPLNFRNCEEEVFQRKRILSTIESFARFINNPKKTDNPNKILEIKLYREFASIRGIKIDRDLTIVGWYTYHFEGNTIHIRGHHNPVIVKPYCTSDGRILYNFFTKEFEDLWIKSEYLIEEIEKNPQLKQLFSPERLKLMDL